MGQRKPGVRSGHVPADHRKPRPRLRLLLCRVRAAEQQRGAEEANEGESHHVVPDAPAECVKFLFVRVQSKMIKNGRYDLEIIIKDAGGDLVALSHHVVLAVSAERNTAARRKVDSGSAEAKL